MNACKTPCLPGAGLGAPLDDVEHRPISMDAAIRIHGSHFNLVPSTSSPTRRQLFPSNRINCICSIG